MAERISYDIARDLRRRIGMDDLLIEAADKLEVTIRLLATAERERDEARAAERARVVAALCRRSELNGYAAVYADLIEKGEI